MTTNNALPFAKSPLLVLGDSISTRLFFSCGIVAALHERLRGRLQVLAAFDLELIRRELDGEVADAWASGGPGGRRLLGAADVLRGRRRGFAERVRLAFDRRVNETFGYFSLAMRQNLRWGFNKERWRRGHPNPFLDPRRAWPLPRSERLFRMISRWYFGAGRYLDPAVLDFLRERASCAIFNNVQFPGVQPYLLAAHRLKIPVIGYIGSWDHPVGKGVISPHCVRYLVQNATMREALVRFHGIDSGRIVETGWPQADLFARKRPEADYRRLIASYGLDPNRRCVLVTGNTEANAPYEPNFVERLVGWHERHDPDARNVIFRPHPKDGRWKARFASVLGRRNVFVQQASLTDVEVACVLLQHVDCVVTNAGTILLDSVANDRPVVCVLYDEGAPPGSAFAAGNVSGRWYAELLASGAFHRAENFEEAVAAILRSLERPGELAAQRAAVTRLVMGEVDGGASRRVVEGIAEKAV